MPEPFTSVFQWIAGGQLGGETYLISRSLFLRGLGIIYLIAFISFWVQMKGLVGSQGILPVPEFLSAVKNHYGTSRFWELPTVFWLNGGDTALHVVCAIGVAASIGLICGFAPMLTAVLLWALYLSIVNVGQDFLSFQWDILLIEAGFLAILFAPLGWWLSSATAPPSPLALLLLWFLVAKLMFESGVVKLTSGDNSWLDMTALSYHYESQPLPTWTAWYMHNAPLWVHKLSAVIMYFIELVLPIFMFLTAPLRLIAAAGTALLNLVIMGTGNYNFFNLLTMVLCIPLVSDRFWQKLLPNSLTNVGSAAGSIPAWLSAIIAIVAVLAIIISIPQLTRSISPGTRLRGMEKLEMAIRQFHSFNSYGLFRVMTKSRPEIVIEGSNDGQNWSEYEFKDKPGDLNRKPRFIEPHQPRLDWQMWFAALSNWQQTYWFQNFLGRLMEGSKDVTALLKRNPFPDGPRYIRAQYYDYTFTSSDERKATGEWWKRELKGQYSPQLQRQ